MSAFSCFLPFSSQFLWTGARFEIHLSISFSFRLIIIHIVFGTCFKWLTEELRFLRYFMKSACYSCELNYNNWENTFPLFQGKESLINHHNNHSKLMESIHENEHFVQKLTRPIPKWTFPKRTQKSSIVRPPLKFVGNGDQWHFACLIDK